MRKAGMLLSLMLLVMSMTLVRAEDENEKDDNGSIVTDLPYAEEMEGEVFGALYGNIDEDIDIDIPVVEEPEKPKEETPVTRPQEERPKDEQEAGDTNGSSAGNSAGNNTEGSGNSPIYGGNASLLSLRPNIADANQEVYGINADGTGTDGVVYYRWIEKQEHLTIYPALVTKAKEEQKNIVMRVVDRKEKKMHYRLRLQYADIKDMKEETMRFEFGAKCEHKKAMYELAGTDDIVYLLQCKQEHIKVPVYIGVAVPEAWDHAYGVYQYALEQQDFIYIRKDLQIDEENVVEVKMAPGKDYVFAQQSLPVEDRSLKTWVSGLSGGSQKVDQKLALGSTAMFAAAGFLGVTLLMGVYMKKSGKGAWGKRSKES